MLLLKEVAEKRTAVPRFDDQEKRPELGDVERHAQYLRTIRAVMRELRKELVASGRYKGSKLHYLDCFSVKQSELLEWPVYLINFSVEKASKGARKPANQGGSSAKPGKRPSQKRKVEKGDEEFVPAREKRANAGKMPGKYAD
jgi:hypothetical protein